MSKRFLFLLLIFLTGFIILLADFVILLYFGHSFSDINIKFGIPALAFMLIYCGALGRNAKYFSSDYFKGCTWKELEARLIKIGSVPIKTIFLGLAVHLLFLGGIYIRIDYLGIAQGARVLLFLVSMAFGLMMGAFTYVMGDNLVAGSLLSNKITEYPRNLREKRQATKAIIIPVVVCFMTVIYATSVTLLGIREIGGSLDGLHGTAWLIILVPMIIFFMFVFALGANLKKNANKLFTSVIVELENLSSERKDLTRRVSVCSVDELGTVAGMVNDFSRHLSEGILHIKGSQGELAEVGNRMEEDASGMAASISQITSSSEQILGKAKDQKKSADYSFQVIEHITRHIRILEKSVETQYSSMNQASAAVEEMVGNITAIGALTEKMASQFKTVEKSAGEGSSIQKESGERIHQIVSQSQGLQETNKIIATIAAKTNLLAMNAAIEAAHAGEAGRGFSVVADEIRKLAENSATESQKIGADLKQIMNTIDQIVRDAEVSASAFAEVFRQVGETDVLVVEVDNAIREQRTGAAQVLQSLRTINDLTAQVTTGYKELSQSSETMLGQIKDLEDSSGEISTNMEEISGGIKTLNTGAKEVSDMANVTKSSIQKISGIVDEFVV